MKLKQRVFHLVMILCVSSSYASQHDVNQLQTMREQVAKRYMADLQTADYKDIASLFESNGVVISISRGKINAKDFFYSFLPTIKSAKIEVHQTFKSGWDINRIAARFHYSYQLKNGETGNGEYIDEFVFSENSYKLSAVYMFENLHFS